MPFKIDRVPQGLLNLLNTRGGLTPAELEDRVRGTIELAQFYGSQQRQNFTASNGALAENTIISTTITTNWVIAFSGSLQIVKTATVTALRGSLFAAGPFGSVCLAHDDCGPFGATETGNTRVNFIAPYPMLFPPGTNFFGIVDILGTDATASVTVNFNLGVLQN